MKGSYLTKRSHGIPRPDFLAGIKTALSDMLCARLVPNPRVIFVGGGVQCIGHNKYCLAAQVNERYEVEVTWELTGYSFRLYGNVVVRHDGELAWHAGFRGVCDESIATGLVKFIDSPEAHKQRLSLFGDLVGLDDEQTYHFQDEEYGFRIDSEGNFLKFTANEVAAEVSTATVLARLAWTGGLIG